MRVNLLLIVVGYASIYYSKSEMLRGIEKPPGISTYIVILDDDVDKNDSNIQPTIESEARKITKRHGGRVQHVYRNVFRGFAVTLTSGQASTFQQDPNVRYIEPDGRIDVMEQPHQALTTGIRRIFADLLLPFDGTDHHVDVDVAVIDTGVDFNHPDLNVVGLVDCTTLPCVEGRGNDEISHGTHVAGIIGALDNSIGSIGVAPGARIWSVKVIDDVSGVGKISSIIAALDWVANSRHIHVASMCFMATGTFHSMYYAIQRAVDLGVSFAVAAGNSHDDAANYSPAQFDNVLTVSALADTDGTIYNDNGVRNGDTLADFSNWGKAVDVVAPGTHIYSTMPGGSYGFKAGTSMAAAYVAGALALLASRNPPANAEDVHLLYSLVIDNGNDGWVDTSRDVSKEALLDLSNADIFYPRFFGANQLLVGDELDSAAVRLVSTFVTMAIVLLITWIIA